MKLIKFLLNNNGKSSLSTAQAIGLVAAAGVAGLAVGQMFSSSKDVNSDTVFSSNNSSDVVYVVGGGAPNGDYSGYIEGGAPISTSSYARTSRDLDLMEQDRIRAAAAKRPGLDEQEGNIQAFKMDGRSEGLGMGGNEANERKVGGNQGGKGGPDLADIQARISQAGAQARAQQQDAAGQAGAVGENARAAGSNSEGRFGMNSGMARASGNAFNSTPLQASTPGSRRSGTLSTDGASGIPNRAQMRDVSAKYEGGRDSILEEGKRFRGNTSLEGLRKMSADVAANRNRAVNEAGWGFFAAGKQSGGFRVAGSTSALDTRGNSSSDFLDIKNMPNVPTPGMPSMSISGVEDAIDEAALKAEEYANAREQLEQDIKDFADRCNKWSWWSLFAGPASVVREGLMYGIVGANSYSDMLDKIDTFVKTYGSYETGSREEDAAFEDQAFSTQALTTVKNVYGAMWQPGRPKKSYENWSSKWTSAAASTVGNSSGTTTNSYQSGTTTTTEDSVGYSGVVQNDNPYGGYHDRDALPLD